MAINTDEIRVGANGSVYVAPTGTTLPVEPDDALDAAFVDLGAITEDGVTLSPSQSIEKIKAWQSSKAVRVLKTEDELSVGFTLMEWNEDTFGLAFGGGTVSATTGTETKWVPPAAGSVDERAFVVEWTDDTITYRLVIPKGIVSETGEIALKKSDASGLEVTVEVLGSSPDDFIIYTDDPAWP